MIITRLKDSFILLLFFLLDFLFVIYLGYTCCDGIACHTAELPYVFDQQQIIADKYTWYGYTDTIASPKRCFNSSNGDGSENDHAYNEEEEEGEEGEEADVDSEGRSSLFPNIIGSAASWLVGGTGATAGVENGPGLATDVKTAKLMVTVQ